VLGGAAILVVGGLVAFRYVGRSVPTAPTSLAATSAPSEAAPTPSPATGAVTSSTASLTASAAAAASTRSVSLGVAPPDARVDVDGVSATIANGVVILTGTLGSSHKVHVASGKRETTVDVVVAEVGAVPSHVELDAHPAPGGRPAGAGAPAPPPTPPTFQRDFH